jgi:murein DD-endopeptidase MepM/ murein hydrolase activator NlpD
MTRLLLLGLALALALATPALGDDVGVKKEAVDSKIAVLNQALAAQQQREAALRNEIDGVSSRLAQLETQVGDVSLQINTLEQDLSLRRERLGKLNQLFHLQSQRLQLLTQQYKLSVNRLNERLVSIYESRKPSTLEIVLGAGSIQEALDLTSYVTKIGQEDKHVAAEVAHSKLVVEQARTKTAKLKKKIEGEARARTARVRQTEEARNALVGATNSLASTRQQKLVALDDLSAQERAGASEIDALQAASAALAAQIRAAQARSTGPSATPSSAGLIWPVSGPVTSPFGWRWGRMHQGIDIGAGTGTPIDAAAAGTVIYCGWEGGYGNLVVIDHGGNLATAYGHQSAIAVTCGQQVGQGQVIGYVGCTGHCTGPHLHFEVRINGEPVDPLGYL